MAIDKLEKALKALDINSAGEQIAAHLTAQAQNRLHLNPNDYFTIRKEPGYEIRSGAVSLPELRRLLSMLPAPVRVGALTAIESGIEICLVNWEKRSVSKMECSCSPEVYAELARLVLDRNLVSYVNKCKPGQGKVGADREQERLEYAVVYSVGDWRNLVTKPECFFVLRALCLYTDIVDSEKTKGGGIGWFAYDPVRNQQYVICFAGEIEEGHALRALESAFWLIRQWTFVDFADRVHLDMRQLTLDVYGDINARLRQMLADWFMEP